MGDAGWKLEAANKPDQGEGDRSSSIFRHVFPDDWVFFAVELPYKHAHIWSHVLVKAIRLAMIFIITLIFVKVIPDPNWTKLVVFYVFALPFIDSVHSSPFLADLLMIVHRDFLVVYKGSRLITSARSRSAFGPLLGSDQPMETEKGEFEYSQERTNCSLVNN